MNWSRKEAQEILRECRLIRKSLEHLERQAKESLKSNVRPFKSPAFDSESQSISPLKDYGDDLA